MFRNQIIVTVATKLILCQATTRKLENFVCMMKSPRREDFLWVVLVIHNWERVATLNFI